MRSPSRPPRRLRARSALALCLGASFVPTTGCVSWFGRTPSARVGSSPAVDFALVGAPRSETEREGRLSAADDDQPNGAALQGAFWGGVIVGSAGAATAVGFGIGGAVTSKQIEDGYQDGTSVEERDKLVDRGKAFNTVAITGASLAITGLAVAAIAHAIDQSRCGPRRRKREGCR